MNPVLKFNVVVYVALTIATIFKIGLCQEGQICNRRPLSTNTAPLPADNRFVIEIKGVNKKYIPNKNYTIRLYSRDEETTFIAFTISANGDTKYNEKNPRKPTPLEAGTIVSSQNSSDTSTITKDICPNTIFQSDITPKTSVEALWIAPPKENKCVTIYAFVAVKPDVWYSNDGPLSKQVCEDERKDEDMPPPENADCRACEEARYELRFEGLWSFNTHQLMFPKTKELARFSDIVGASHSKNFNLFKLNADASDELKMLAEQGNTTKFEEQIVKGIGSTVRTLIKATSPPKPNMATVTSFRASPDRHFISMVTAILPSPDWFTGVSNLELCNVETKTWSDNITLNLYPMDAGTDSGPDFDSPNDQTSPPQPISLAKFSNKVQKEQLKPFARLRILLVRTYTTPQCMAQQPSKETQGRAHCSLYRVTFLPSGKKCGVIDEAEEETRETDNEEPHEEYSPPERTEPPQLVTDPTMRDCPMTTWEDWWTCEAPCEDGRISGYHTRMRYYIVDGVVVKDKSNGKEVSQYCYENYSDTETEKCTETCQVPKEEPEIEAAQRRSEQDPIRPGQSW